MDTMHHHLDLRKHMQMIRYTCSPAVCSLSKISAVEQVSKRGVERGKKEGSWSK